MPGRQGFKCLGKTRSGWLFKELTGPPNEKVCEKTYSGVAYHTRQGGDPAIGAEPQKVLEAESLRPAFPVMNKIEHQVVPRAENRVIMVV